jgi:hypothetical protein
MNCLCKEKLTSGMTMLSLQELSRFKASTAATIPSIRRRRGCHGSGRIISLTRQVAIQPPAIPSNVLFDACLDDGDILRHPNIIPNKQAYYKHKSRTMASPIPTESTPDKPVQGALSGAKKTGRKQLNSRLR